MNTKSQLVSSRVFRVKGLQLKKKAKRMLKNGQKYVQDTSKCCNSPVVNIHTRKYYGKENVFTTYIKIRSAFSNLLVCEHHIVICKSMHTQTLFH